MTLAVSDEHRQLAESVRALAARLCPPESVRAAANGPDAGAAAYRDAVAPALAEQGLLGLHLPEADGGQGFGLAELAVAAEELGRALVPGSFLPTVLASAVLRAGGVTGKLVSSLADGSATAAVAFLDAEMHALEQPDGSFLIDGTAPVVLGAPGADLILVPVQPSQDTAYVAIDAADLHITPLDGLDLTRPVGRVEADGVIVPASRQLLWYKSDVVRLLAAVIFGAEAVGIARWAVETAAEYAKLRHQFGRPIGQFQAVKHRCARMLVALEQAAAAVWDAARALDEPAGPNGEGCRFAVAAAAALAGEAVVSCTHECIQVLGGIGFTWEHDAHLYYRRALTLQALLRSAGGSPGWPRWAGELALYTSTRAVRLELPGGDEDLRTTIRAELAAIAPLAGKERNAALAAGGWVMPHLPRPWGRGAGALEQLVIAEELRAAGIQVPGLAIGAWVAPALIQYGTAEQQQRFLPATLRLDYLWCQLFSEPGAGSDLAGLTTRAVRADGGWKITGQKIWTSLARHAAWAICIARTDPAQPRHDGISYFLVDMHSPGIEVRPLREITGDSIFNQVFLDDVFVPDDCVVGEINHGWRIARTTLANERVSLAGTWSAGSGTAELLQVARTEHEPGPRLLTRIGELVCQSQAIDLLAVRAALKQLSGTEPGATGSVRKLLSMRHAQQVADLCWELTEAAGVLGGPPGQPVEDGLPNGPYWARQMLQTEAYTIGGGTTDIQLNIIAERILGLPRDPEPPLAT
jgi:alkylation response protein AidB-like acyl-CoA dehydrogenase